MSANFLDPQPRNILWESDYYPKLSDDDFAVIAASPYTHFITAFAHFRNSPMISAPEIVYNGQTPIDDPSFNPHWQRCRALRRPPSSKAVMLSVGGWNSGSWAALSSLGMEAVGARILADFVMEKGFDGVDLNFEGVYIGNSAYLAAMAKLAFHLRRNLGNLLLTITPMYVNVLDQLKAIDHVARLHGQAWTDIVSWVNVQFYSYDGPVAFPNPDVTGDYNDFLGRNGLTASRIAAGFPLEGLGAQGYDAFNLQEAHTAARDLKTLIRQHPDMAGAFVWRYVFTKAPFGLNWAKAIDGALGGHARAAETC